MSSIISSLGRDTSMSRSHRKAQTERTDLLHLLDEEIAKLPQDKRELVLHNLWRKGLISRPQGIPAAGRPQPSASTDIAAQLRQQTAAQQAVSGALPSLPHPAAAQTASVPSLPIIATGECEPSKT